jgi:hypothetical protein
MTINRPEGLEKTKPNKANFLAPSTAGGLITKLKKQSQFSVGQISLTSYMKGDYDIIILFGARKNKANSKPNVLSTF